MGSTPDTIAWSYHMYTTFVCLFVCRFRFNRWTHYNVQNSNNYVAITYDVQCINTFCTHTHTYYLMHFIDDPAESDLVHNIYSQFDIIHRISHFIRFSLNNHIGNGNSEEFLCWCSEWKCEKAFVLFGFE